MLHCTRDFLQARPSVYFSCNERAARFTAATLNLHCRTSRLRQQPDESIQEHFNPFPPIKPFFDGQKELLMHMHSSASASQICPACGGFYRRQLEARGLFLSLRGKSRDWLPFSFVVQCFISWSHRVRVTLKDRKGCVGRGLPWFGILNVAAVSTNKPPPPGATGSPSPCGGRRVKEGTVQRL